VSITDPITNWLQGQIAGGNAYVQQQVDARVQAAAQTAGRELRSMTEVQIKELEGRVVALDGPLRTWASNVLRDPQIQASVEQMGRTAARGAVAEILPWVVGVSLFFVTLSIGWKIIELRERQSR
jgi:hypothetical protein